MPPSQPTQSRKAYTDLEKHVDDLFVALNRTIDEQFKSVYRNIDLHASASNRAVEVAEKANAHVQLLMNEFRRTIDDMMKILLTISVFNVFKESIESRVRDLELSKAKIEGKASQSAFVITLIISLIGILLGVVSLILK